MFLVYSKKDPKISYLDDTLSHTHALNENAPKCGRASHALYIYVYIIIFLVAVLLLVCVYI